MASVTNDILVARQQRYLLVTICPLAYSDKAGEKAVRVQRQRHTPQFDGGCSMKLSARNQIPGTIKTVKSGATTTHVTIEISPSVTVTASITNEAAEELALKPGMK